MVKLGPLTTDLDFNPASRQNVDFLLQTPPSKLSIIAGKLSWVLNTQIYVDGADFSHWNWSPGREPDFRIVHDNGFDFVILKATESDWFVDDKFGVGWRAALDAGLIVMPYHFNRTNKGGAVQAHWHLDHIVDYLKAVDGKTILWNDVETVDGNTSITQNQNRAKAYNQTIVGEGFETGNYSSYSAWKRIMGDKPLSWVNDYHQWFAHWTPSANPLKPIGWLLEEFWQYSIWPKYSWAKVVGTNGNVDVIRFYGTLQNLKDMLGITPPLPPDCCEEIKAVLAGVLAELVVINSKLNDHESSIAALHVGWELHDKYINDLQEQGATLSQQIVLLDEELKKTQAQVVYQGKNQSAMQTQLDLIFSIMAEIKKLLP